MRTERERPQGQDDVRTLIARLQQIERGTPEQGLVYRHLLGKLLPFADPPARYAAPAGGPAACSSPPSR